MYAIRSYYATLPAAAGEQVAAGQLAAVDTAGVEADARRCQQRFCKWGMAEDHRLAPIVIAVEKLAANPQQVVGLLVRRWSPWAQAGMGEDEPGGFVLYRQLREKLEMISRRRPAAAHLITRITSYNVCYTKLLRADPTPPTDVQALLLCSGKIYYELAERRQLQGTEGVTLWLV